MDDPARRLSRGDLAAIAALADGRLEGRRRERLERRLGREPALAAELERQRRALRAIDAAAASTAMPQALRARLEAMRAEAAAEGVPQRRAVRRPRLLAPAAGLAAAAVVVAILAVLALPGGGLTVEQALAFADRAPTAPAARSGDSPRLLGEQLDGVRFPDYAGKFGWRAVGVRTDEADGRTVRTVFYERDGAGRIAYSIVAGDALDVPDAAERAVREGVTLHVLEGGGAVTWEGQGRTCVLSGAAPTAKLLELAAWQGRGDVVFQPSSASATRPGRATDGS